MRCVLFARQLALEIRGQTLVVDRQLTRYVTKNRGPMPTPNFYHYALNKLHSTYGLVKGMFKWLRQNPRWVYAALLIAAGIWVGDRLEEKQAFLDLRYRAYQITQDAAGRLKGELYDHNTILVLIGDDEYWKGPYEGRRPINRESLGQLVAALDRYNPKVIALDFDFSSPVPDGSIVEFPKYAEETKKLADTIKEVSSRRSVVVPRTLGFDGQWIEESDVYNKYDLGQARFGYIALYSDYRLVPKSLPLKSGDRLDSFAEAIVRCFDLTGNGVKCDHHDESLTYAGAYLYEDQFKKYSANQIISPDSATQRDLVEKLPGKIVIIGGAWSRYAFNRGSRIDERYTPVGLGREHAGIKDCPPAVVFASLDAGVSPRIRRLLPVHQQTVVGLETVIYSASRTFLAGCRLHFRSKLWCLLRPLHCNFGEFCQGRVRADK